MKEEVIYFEFEKCGTFKSKSSPAVEVEVKTQPKQSSSKTL